MSILIKNGTIVDGTGSERYKADILIKGDEIVELGENLNTNGANVIDATDRIVSPGFVDIHNHADMTILDLPDIKPYVLQGATTLATGMCGFGISPSNDLVRRYYVNFANRLLSLKADLCDDLLCFMEKAAKSGISVNLAYLVPQGNIRGLVKGVGEDPANEEEIKKMQDVMRKEMDAGAFGMTTGLAYAPGSVTKTEEIIELAKIISEYNGVYMSHMRNEGAGVIDIGMNELIRIAREAKSRAHISHWSVVSSSVEEMTANMIKAVEDARAEGLDITADITVYNDAVTPIAFIMFNTWVFEDYENNLTNPETRAKIFDEIFEKIDAMFLKDAPRLVRMIPKFLLKRIMWPVLTKKVSILSCPNNMEIQGKTLYEATQMLYPGKKTKEAFLDLMRDEEGGIIITLVTKNEEKGMLPLYNQPYVCSSSDGIVVVNPEQNEHPRNYGTFPRVIQRWVREMKCVSLETAIKKMTSLPAEILGIKDRGVLKKGNKADIVIFDLKNIKEKGTLENGKQHPEGIDYVIINGQITAENGKHLGTRNGRVLIHKK